jgi:aspartate racemase
MPQKIVGVLGGMGPMSTADLFVRIVRATPVAREQDHLRMLVDNNPKIPDRTEALRCGDTAPAVEALRETARDLERSGAELIGIPCNTAHAFLSEIRASVTVPVLDMVELLATDGTLETGLYHDALDRRGLVAVAPRPETQANVMSVIYEMKLRDVSPDCMERLEGPIEDLSGQGATALIPGCTEIALVLSRLAPELPWLDPLQALAEALVREATGRPPSS